MAKKKTCFVLSPIGDPGSATRQRADDLFDLVVLPALEPFQFDVVRADRIPGSGTITSEIVALLQTAELCVVDLTDSNPNVFYECGRRHETARPYVHLIAAGHSLPFDLAGIRTINYDLSTARSAHEASQELRRFIEENEQSGYVRSSAATLNSLTNVLDRIEEKIDRVASRATMTSALPVPEITSSSSGVKVFARRKGPIQRRMLEAITEGDTGSAVALLPEMEAKLGLTADVAFTAAMLANAGFEAGASTVFRVCKAATPAELAKVISPFTSAVGFYHDEDREEEIVEAVESFADVVMQSEDVPDSGKAEAMNQLQRVYYGLHRHDDAAEAGRQAVSLDPEDVAYRTNLIANLLELGHLREAEEHVDWLLTVDSDAVRIRSCK